MAASKILVPDRPLVEALLSDPLLGRFAMANIAHLISDLAFAAAPK